MGVLEMLQKGTEDVSTAVSAEVETKEKKVSEKTLKKAKKQIEKGVDKFSDKKSDSYWKDVEHNINAWCSIWESSTRAKAYREGWNNIYKYMGELNSQNEEKE